MSPLMLSDLVAAFGLETGRIAVQEPESISGFVYQRRRKTDARLNLTVRKALGGRMREVAELAVDWLWPSDEGRGDEPAGSQA